MRPDPLNLVIAGVGGQGNVLASALLGSAAVSVGLQVAVGETYGASQRGGCVRSHVRFSKLGQPGPLVPRGQAHLLLGLEPMEALRVARSCANPSTRALVSRKPIPPLNVLRGEVAYPDLQAIFDELAARSATLWLADLQDEALTLGEAMSFNVLMVGALAAREALPFGLEPLRAAICAHLPANKRALNLQALERGAQARLHTVSRL